MNPNLASGDNCVSTPMYQDETERPDGVGEIMVSDKNCDNGGKNENITPLTIEENEMNLKERIAHCKNVVQSLKQELNDEKEKIKAERKQQSLDTAKYVSTYHENGYELENSTMYSACVDSKLYCDENLIEYEKQLQKYQNTLNMAQNEKKNAIRKQMLRKAFKLKLMEIENQCNIEMLRIKQSMQCLEPLQMIVNKWKTEPEEILFDVNNFELMPSFLELKSHSGSDVNSLKEPLEMKLNKEPETCNSSKDDSVLD